MKINIIKKRIRKISSQHNIKKKLKNHKRRENEENFNCSHLYESSMLIKCFKSFFKGLFPLLSYIIKSILNFFIIF